MSEPLVQAASRLVESCALVAIGYNLRRSGILRSSDGETAIKLASSLTLPAVILQALGNGPPLGSSALSLLGVAGVCMGAQLAATWLYCMHRQPRERAVLAGSATGLSLRLFGYPLAEAFFAGGSGGVGAVALQSVALVDTLNHFAVWLGSYLLFAGAGPAFPASLAHEDGGEYRGQWRGMVKEGLGVYTYASGARYEGEWRNNVKEGRGVYTFPKGGVYEGEWAGGVMSGLGVRTLSTGQVKAGRWRDGQLETPLELWQVALAADGAAAVAAAARSVEVGGGRPVDGAHMLAAQPALWALAAGLAINLLRAPLPPWLDALTGVLAPANAPLCLLAAGATAPNVAALLSGKVPKHLLADIARLLGSRLLVPLTVGLALTAMAAAGSGVDGTAAAAAAATLVPLAATTMALLAPVPPQAQENARRFRLNEATAAAISSASYLTCLPLMLVLGTAAVAAGLAAPPATAVTDAAAAAAAVVVDARPLLAFGLAAVAAVGAAVGHFTQRAERDADGGRGGGAALSAAAAAAGEGRSVYGNALAVAAGGGGGAAGQRVFMVYAGPVADRAAPPAAATQGTTAAAADGGDASSVTSDAAGAASRGGGGGAGDTGPTPSAGGVADPREEASGGDGGASSSGGRGTGGGGGGARPQLPPPNALQGSGRLPFCGSGLGSGNMCGVSLPPTCSVVGRLYGSRCSGGGGLCGTRGGSPVRRGRAGVCGATGGRLPGLSTARAPVPGPLPFSRFQRGCTSAASAASASVAAATPRLVHSRTSAVAAAPCPQARMCSAAAAAAPPSRLLLPVPRLLAPFHLRRPTAAPRHGSERIPVGGGSITLR